MIVQASLYTMADGILYYIGLSYYIGHKDSVPKVVVPSEYKKRLMEECHAGVMSGHFSGPSPVEECGILRYAHRTPGKYVSHCIPNRETCFLNIVFKVLLNLSTILLHCGW